MDRINIVTVVIGTLLLVLAGIHYKWPEMIPGFVENVKGSIGRSRMGAISVPFTVPRSVMGTPDAKFEYQPLSNAPIAFSFTFLPGEHEQRTVGTRVPIMPSSKSRVEVLDFGGMYGKVYVTLLPYPPAAQLPAPILPPIVAPVVPSVVRQDVIAEKDPYTPILFNEQVAYIIPVTPAMFGKNISLTYQPTSPDGKKIVVIARIPGMREDEQIYSFQPNSSGETIAFKFNGPDGTQVFRVNMTISPYPVTPSNPTGFMSLPSRPMWRGVWSKK